MMNILHAIDTSGPGGAESVFMTLARLLPSSRFRSYVALPATGWLYDQLTRHGFTPFLVGGRRGFDIGYLWKLIRIVREQRIDVVQSHLFGSNLYCCLAGMITRVPVVCTFHGGVDVGRRSLGQRIKLAVIRRLASKIVSVSGALEAELRLLGGFTAARCSVIYNAIDLAQYTPRRENSIRRQFGIDDDDVLIGAVGNIRPAKDYATLLRAAAILAPLSPRYKVLIAGEGRNSLHEQLVRQRSELGLEQVVHFAGFQADVPRFLNNLDLFVLSSNSEGFSISTIEAMACQLPVVATRSGGPEEIVESGVNGVLVDVGDSAELAGQIQKLAEDMALRQRLAAAARETVLERYNMPKMLSSYEAIYESL